MKYFTAKIDGKDEILGSAGETKRYLKAHPEIESVVRWWWSGNDLIECEDYSREQILGATVKKSEQGQTAQWAVDHYFAPNPGVIEGSLSTTDGKGRADSGEQKNSVKAKRTSL